MMGTDGDRTNGAQNHNRSSIVNISGAASHRFPIQLFQLSRITSLAKTTAQYTTELQAVSENLKLTVHLPFISMIINKWAATHHPLSSADLVKSVLLLLGIIQLRIIASFSPPLHYHGPVGIKNVVPRIFIQPSLRLQNKIGRTSFTVPFLARKSNGQSLQSKLASASAESSSNKWHRVPNFDIFDSNNNNNNDNESEADSILRGCDAIISKLDVESNTLSPHRWVRSFHPFSTTNLENLLQDEENDSGNSSPPSEALSAIEAMHRWSSNFVRPLHLCPWAG